MFTEFAALVSAGVFFILGYVNEGAMMLCAMYICGAIHDK